jgi:hypothetical protein
MSNRPKRGNKRNRDFKVVARATRRREPDIARITRTSLDVILAQRELEAELDHLTGSRPSSPKGQEPGHGAA